MKLDADEKQILLMLIAIFVLGVLVGYGCPHINCGSSSDSSRDNDDDYYDDSARYREWYP